MLAGLEDLGASTTVGEEITVCPEQGSISTGTKDSQMGSLECGRMEHSIVDCRCLAYLASYIVEVPKGLGLPC